MSTVKAGDYVRVKPATYWNQKFVEFAKGKKFKVLGVSGDSIHHEIVPPWTEEHGGPNRGLADAWHLALYLEKVEEGGWVRKTLQRAKRWIVWPN